MKIKILDQTISQLLAADVVFEYPVQKIWNANGISLQKRLASNENFRRKVDAALRTSSLEQYIVVVDPLAPERCIDGRITKGWEDFNHEQKSSLGPKVPGGTAHAALTHRIVNVSDMTKNLLFENDIKEVVNIYKSVGASVGGHVDSHHKGWNTGCGAVDNINLILEKLQRPEPHEQIRRAAKHIMGDSYDGIGITSDVFGRMLYLDGMKPSYMPKQGGVAEGEFLYKKTIADLIRREAKSNSEPVPELIGEHKEIAIVLNYVRGTTFDTDRFSHDNKNELQVFSWDIWETYEEAARLYPYDMSMPFKEQKISIHKRMRHVTCRILLGVATTMVLTDGSQKLITVKSGR